MNKKLLALSVLVALVGFGATSLALEVGSSKDGSVVASKDKKLSAKKKVEMCSECGKPESECECHDKKEHKSHEHNEKGTEKTESEHSH